jgi:hypothetical protein
MKMLIFKYHDHAVMFKVLNNLPKKVEVRYIDNKRTAIFFKNKPYKYKLTDTTQGRNWIIS